ncbi:hypothetical protein N9P71_06175 [Saprospiraceae bacterium]|nr:hypothetical protein [Saprospiraceae bacterium]
MKRSYWTLIGVLLFGVCALSFILSLVGVNLTMLKFLDHPSYRHVRWDHYYVFIKS